MQMIIGDGAGAQTAASSGKWVKESDTQNFMADVIDASNEVPVLVDFWAPWCGPCKQLGPILEKVVEEANGAVRLVKINIDENQALAGQMRIQSIPAVYAFSGGRPVDGFMGALPESEIRAFIGRLAGAEVQSPVEAALEQGKEALKAGDVEAAAAMFGQILQHEPEHPQALAGLVQVALAAGDTAQARQIADMITPNAQHDPMVSAAFSALQLAEEVSQESGDVSEQEARLAANPDDHQARFDLAMALFAVNRRDEAADALIEIVRRDRPWNEEAARKQLVKFFEAWGPADPHTVAARRKLSSVLFS